MFKKIFITLLIFIVAIVIGLFTVYHFYFKPTVQTTTINTNVQINESQLIKKFMPNDINLSFTEVSASSETLFSAQELTDLSIIAINEIPEAKKYVTGVKVDINGQFVDLYLSLKAYGIPLEAKLIFEPSAKDGKGIFHYVGGKLGFFNIPKDLIFNNVTDTSVVQFDKANDNIILSFKTITALKVEQFSTSGNNLKIVFKATLKFWDWLK